MWFIRRGWKCYYYRMWKIFSGKHPIAKTRGSFQTADFVLKRSFLARAWYFLKIPCKMNAFWWHLYEKLSKKTPFNQGQHQCNKWVGCLEHGTYGKVTVIWPYGTKSVERCHRVSYMAAQKILRGDMPRTDNNRKKLDVSHLCHNSICVKPTHLVLETHQTN